MEVSKGFHISSKKDESDFAFNSNKNQSLIKVIQDRTTTHLSGPDEPRSNTLKKVTIMDKYLKLSTSSRPAAAPHEMSDYDDHTMSVSMTAY